MVKSMGRLLGLLLVSQYACAPANDITEDRRGDSAYADHAVEIISDIRSVEADTDDGPQRAVILEGETIPGLSALQLADLSELPENFMANIMGIHKISATKTMFYGTDQNSWVYDESAADSELTMVRSEIIAPPSSQIYVLEDQNFWLLGEGSLAFSTPSSNEDLWQLGLVNVSPELMQDPNRPFQVLFAGPNAFIIEHEGRINITKRVGEAARFVNLDLPSSGNQTKKVLAAGVGEGSDHFWFLTATALKVLSRNEAGDWVWLVSAFQAPVPEDAGLQIAMFTTGAVEGRPRFTGKTIFQIDQQLYEQDSLRLVIRSDVEITN